MVGTRQQLTKPVIVVFDNVAKEIAQMPRGCPGRGGGGWAPLELIDAL